MSYANSTNDLLSAADSCGQPKSSPARQLHSELMARWHEAGPQGLAAFLDEHPDLEDGGHRSLLLELVVEVYNWHKANGERLDRDAFCNHFPRIKTELIQYFAVTQHMADHPELAAQLRVAAGEPPAPGDTFLGFSLLRELGRGNFARVFLAAEPALGNRIVAVKIGQNGASEAAMLGRVQHRNIVPIHSARTDRAAGLSAVCMPYLGDATLLDAKREAFGIRQRPISGQFFVTMARARLATSETVADLPPPDGRLRRLSYDEAVAYLGAQLADALAHAHVRGIFHRDLKPSNVLLGWDGKPMLMDFNLAGELRSIEQVAGGTIPYMSPEHRQVFLLPKSGDVPLVDGRSDIFQLGVILYEFLTGHLPFDYRPPNGNSKAEVADAIRRLPGAPRPLCEFAPSVDRRLASIIHRCLANHPSERPQTAAELAGLLHEYVSRRNCMARWFKRHSRLTIAAAMTIVALGTGVAQWWATMPPYAVAQLRLGWDAYNRGDYPAAIEHFGRANRSDPSLNEAYYAQGRAFLRAGNLPEAIKLLEEAFRHDNNDRYLVARAYCYGLKSDLDTAASDFRFAVKRGCRSAIVFNNLGYTSMRAKPPRLDEAADWLEKAIQLDPDLTAAYHNRILGDCRKTMLSGGKLPESWRGDLESALSRGSPPGELLLDAARLYALAAKSEPAWLSRAQECLDRASRVSAVPSNIRDDPILGGLNLPLNLAALPLTALTTNSTCYSLFLDPIQD